MSQPCFNFQPNMIQVLSDARNFTYTLFDPSDGEWEGDILANGNSTGALREVALELADMGASNFLMARTHKLVDFLYPHQVEKTCFLVSLEFTWYSLVQSQLRSMSCRC